MDFSKHAQLRFAQRNLRPDEINYITKFGAEFHKDGALIYYLRRRDIPLRDQPNDHWMRLEGTAVFYSTDEQTVITAWRNREKGLQRIQCKTKYASRNNDKKEYNRNV